jgi:histidinol dehydrogenase
MRILRLTRDVQETMLRSRRGDTRRAEHVAARIVNDVRRDGDAALFSWMRRLDDVSLGARTLWVSRAKLREARLRASRSFVKAVGRAARNIRVVARRQMPQAWTMEVEPGVRVGQRVIPIETVGCYVPGGRFSLVSTLLMTVVPAQEAGVKTIVVASPRPSDQLLAAAEILGVRSIACIGGAQAIAAFAYGTQSIPRVDKIFGPGNRYVTAAKRIVSADCAIDLLAGPTETVIFALEGNPRFIAADMIAQAEHDPDAVALLVTTSQRLAKSVAAEIGSRLKQLPRANPARRSIAKNAAVLIARSVSDAVRFINLFAPEHLSLAGSASELIAQFDSAGSIFLNDWSAQPIGDYASGTNHVLPTGGVARARGGLSAGDFVKCISVQEISRQGLLRLAPVVAEFAEAEGLAAHGRAVEVRL